MDEKSRYERGLAKLAEVDGKPGLEAVSRIGDLGRLAVEFAFGDIYSREGLSLRDREIASVAILTALGGREPQLKVHIGAALNVGVTEKEIEEIIIHTVVYAGLPTAINAYIAMKKVFKERRQKSE
ncbi:MAG: carboxymuconolactone decarboxylase family protein [Bacillota bacterium]